MQERNEWVSEESSQGVRSDLLTVWQLCIILESGLKWGNGASFVMNDGETSHTMRINRV